MICIGLLLVQVGALAGMGGTMYWIQGGDPVRYPPHDRGNHLRLPGRRPAHHHSAEQRDEQAARACLRANDVLARWDGEEFLLLLPDATPEDARLVLERMAEHVRTMPVPGLHGRRISFSAVLATRRDGEPFANAIHRADKALYRAKEAGRDRIVLH